MANVAAPRFSKETLSWIRSVHRNGIVPRLGYSTERNPSSRHQEVDGRRRGCQRHCRGSPGAPYRTKCRGRERDARGKHAQNPSISKRIRPHPVALFAHGVTASKELVLHSSRRINSCAGRLRDIVPKSHFPAFAYAKSAEESPLLGKARRPGYRKRSKYPHHHPQSAP